MVVVSSSIIESGLETVTMALSRKVKIKTIGI